jgi:hypothetical protein
MQLVALKQATFSATQQLAVLEMQLSTCSGGTLSQSSPPSFVATTLPALVVPMQSSAEPQEMSSSEGISKATGA